jgi:hypothetical protein
VGGCAGRGFWCKGLQGTVATCGSVATCALGCGWFAAPGVHGVEGVAQDYGMCVPSLQQAVWTTKMVVVKSSLCAYLGVGQTCAACAAGVAAPCLCSRITVHL